MSIPTLTGLTLIDSADTTTDWSGWGSNSNKWDVTADIVKEGNNSNALQPRVTGDGGWGYQTGANVDLSSNLLMVWVFVIAPNFVQSFASTPAGVYIRVTDSTTSWTTTYDDYYVGGSDVAWVGRGWHLVVLDVNRTRDRGSGTVTLSTIRRIGVGFNQAATAAKSDVIAIDAMYYGNTLEATGPSVGTGVSIDLNTGGTIDRNSGSFTTDGWETGDFVKITGSATSANDGVYEITSLTATTLTTGATFTQDTANTSITLYASVTLEDIYQKDGPTDDDWKGVVDKDPGGAYILNYPLTVGDVSGALDCFFLSRNESVVLSDQPMSTTREDYIITAEDTGETYLLFGNSDGTGDDRVGFAGSVFTGQDSIFSTSTPRGMDLDVEIAGLEVYGSSFTSVDAGVSFAATGTDHYVTNVGFTNSGQIDLGGVEARGLTFSGYDLTADGALLWNSTIDIRNSNFLANTNGTDASAIEHPTAGTFSYNGLLFAGNDYDINFSAASGNLIINATDSDPVTSKKTGAGTVTINNNKSLTIVVQDSDTVKIENAVVAIYDSSDDSVISNELTDVNGESATSVASGTSTYIRVRKSTTASTRYFPIETIASNITVNTTLTVTLIEDEIVSA